MHCCHTVYKGTGFPILRLHWQYFGATLRLRRLRRATRSRLHTKTVMRAGQSIVPFVSVLLHRIYMTRLYKALLSQDGES